MKIKTIGLIVSLILGLLTVLPSTEAQQAKKVFRVGMFSARNPRSIPPVVAFIQGLREHGYVEGENLTIEFRNAQGQLDRLPDLAAELVRLKVNVIVAFGPEVMLRAASRATNTIPIVTLAVKYDPMAKGYIDSLARPGGNITGAFFMQLTLADKSLELLKETLPQVTCVFVLYGVHSADQLPSMAAVAQALGLQLQSLELRNSPYDFESAMATAVRACAEAVTVLGSPLFFSQRTQIAALTVKHRLPAIFPFRHWVELGGLMSYGASLNDMFRYGATYVDKILKGANPCLESLLTVCLTILLEVTSMATVPEIIPVTDLRQDAAAVLKRVQAAHQPLVITQRGRAVAIMLSVEAYERGERERQLLRLLVRGEQEIAAGTGYDLDEVLAEADALLQDEAQ